MARASRLQAEHSGLDLAQASDVAANADGGVVVQECLRESHDRVGERCRLQRRLVRAGTHLCGDERRDHGHDSRLHLSARRGDHPQRGLALALDEPPQRRARGDAAVEAVERVKQCLGALAARAAACFREHRFGRPDDHLAYQLLARAEPAVDGRAAEPQLGGDRLHVHAQPAQVAVHDQRQHILARGCRAPATARRSDAGQPDRHTAELAADVQPRVRALARAVAPAVFAQLAPWAPSTGVISLAQRPALELAPVLADPRPAPLVLLEDPRDLGNIGACVRVAAAVDAAGVLTGGGHDPWPADALRGSAGLHYALPVLRVDIRRALASGARPLLAVDPGGDPIAPDALPPRAPLAFGA